jgi:hypothetical protein
LIEDSKEENKMSTRLWIRTIIAHPLRPRLNYVAVENKCDPAITALAAKLRLGAVPTPGTERVILSSLLSWRDQSKMILETAAHLWAKGRTDLTGKVTIIGSGKYYLKSAHGGQVSSSSSETEIVGFKIGTAGFTFDKPLSVTLTKHFWPLA